LPFNQKNGGFLHEGYKRVVIKMRKRRRYITEETKINIDEEVFNIKAKELICELFVEYVNKLYGHTVVVLKRNLD
jgi:hypothetical protein